MRSDLKAVGQFSVRELRKPRRVSTQRLARKGRKRAIDEHGEARKRQPLGATSCAACCRIVITPVCASTGVEQHAHDRKIEFGARADGPIGPCNATGELRPTIDAVNLEMSPPSVKRNVKRGISLARNRNREIGCTVELVEINEKMREPAG